MVRRLIEYEQVRFTIDQLTQANLRFLTTAEHDNLALDMLGCQATAGKRRANLELVQ
ncbi:hypothetical protein D3C85_1918830 [compost metagenome]